jgi:hypothetical protein
VNINSEYYKNRAELLKTCYGRTQYILGWYSISLKESMAPIANTENFSLATSFIHDIFSKEVMKSSPVNVADSALHLEISIDEATGITYSALMAANRNSNSRSFNFATIPECFVEYSKDETFVARSALLKMSDSSVFSFPTAKEINQLSLNDFSQLLQQLKAKAAAKEDASTSSAAAEILNNHLPDPVAYQKQAEKIKTELAGMHEMVKLLVNQLNQSHKIFTE